MILGIEIAQSRGIRYLVHLGWEIPKGEIFLMKKTKIVSTLGPASTDVDTIVKLIEAGANIFRFNFSHGDHEEHLGRISNVHEAEKKSLVKQLVWCLIRRVPKFGRPFKRMVRLNTTRAISSGFQWTTPWKALRIRSLWLILLVWRR